MFSWNIEFQPCQTNHFNSIESQSDFKHQFYIWWKVMQIGHSDAFCGSFFSVWKPAPNWIMKKRNIGSSHWCRPEALGKPRLVVTSSNFCFQNQMVLLFSKTWVKNLPFFWKFRFSSLSPKFFIKSRWSVDPPDQGLHNQGIDIFVIFSTFLLRNAHIWLKTRFLGLKPTDVDFRMPWN